jgi:tRNA modification GTPase
MNATQAACLTPAGSGAIAVIAIQGPEAWPIAARLFRPAAGRRLPEQPKDGAAWFGRLGPGPGDEVILAVSSIDPVPTIEIHCHGGRQVVRMVLDLLRQEGCGETEQLPSGRQGAAARAWALLPYAKTVRTASILLDQANGAFDQAVQAIEQHVQAGRRAEASEMLESLARLESIGRHLVEPWKVAIAGAPNAGKSSLLNALAGYQRSVVAPIPGTTRDVVTATLAFDGWPMELADTAGIREAGDSLEREGVERALKQIAAADLCLWVMDATAPVEIELPAAKVMSVYNKVDLLAASENGASANGVWVSAITGAGLEKLVAHIVATLIPFELSPNVAVPFDAECLKAAGIR